MTRCEKVDSKSDKTKNFSLKIMLLQKLFHSKSSFLKIIFSSKSCFLKKILSSKSCFLKLRVKRKICSFYGLKWIKRWFFFCEKIFQNLLFKFFFSKSCILQKNFSSKSCFSKKYFLCKIWQVLNFSPRPDFYLVFQVLTEWWYLLSILIPTYFREVN